MLGTKFQGKCQALPVLNIQVRKSSEVAVPSPLLNKLTAHGMLKTGAQEIGGALSLMMGWLEGRVGG